MNSCKKTRRNKLRYLRNRNTAFSHVRLLVNNTSLNENMFRFNLVDSRDSECGEGIQTVEHALLLCKNENERRKILEKEVGKVWMDESRKWGHLPFDLRLILAPFALKQLNEEQSSKILDQVFFIYV